jgi:hypothetical protein
VSGGRLYIAAFGWNPVSIAMKVFSHLIYFIKTLAEIPGVARDSRKSERIRVICLSPGSE